MSESEYTPTDNEVRRKYSRGMKSDGTSTQFVKWQKEFDRWLAAHDAELRAQIAAELRGELPVQLAETAQSPSGWLSDAEELYPKADPSHEYVWLMSYDDSHSLGSIDISHVSEHAACIAEGETK